MALTAKQNIFVAEYLIDKNATRAAKAAGYSEKTAYSIGIENLKKPAIEQAINQQIENQRQRVLVDADYIINGIKKIADNSERDGDKLKAYELLGKHLKLFTDKTELTGKDDGEIRIRVNLVDD